MNIYMDANGIKCNGYNSDERYMTIYLVDTTIEDIKDTDWDHLILKTADGTTFMEAKNYTLESIQINIADPDSYVITLRNIDDPVYKDVQNLNVITSTQQDQLDLHGDVLNEIIQLMLE